MTRELIERSLIKSSRRLKEIDTDDRFRYFCGCCWGTIRDLRARAEEIVAGDDAP